MLHTSNGSIASPHVVESLAWLDCALIDFEATIKPQQAIPPFPTYNTLSQLSHSLLAWFLTGTSPPYARLIETDPLPCHINSEQSTFISPPRLDDDASSSIVAPALSVAFLVQQTHNP